MVPVNGRRHFKVETTCFFVNASGASLILKVYTLDKGGDIDPPPPDDCDFVLVIGSQSATKEKTHRANLEALRRYRV